MSRRRLAGLPVVAVAVAVAGLVTGCSFDGLQSVPLPGSPGRGDDAYEVTVELPDVGTLVTNAEVKVNDVAVGTVTDLTVEEWHAEATVSLEKDVELPADATATIGYNSLLGAAYLELADPGGSTVGAVPARTEVLADGDTIPLEQGRAYPSTEEVLAATSTVLTGGGLEQLRTVTVELNKALSSQDGSGVRTLIPRLDSFVGALDDQRADIVTAIDKLDDLSGSFEQDIDVVDTALDALEPGLAVLADERSNLTSALTSLDRLSEVSTRLVRLSKDDLRENLEDLAPALSALNDSGDSLVKGLRYLLTPPFAPESVPNSCRGDYCNLYLNLDLSLQGLLENFGPTTNTGDAGKNGGALDNLGVDELLDTVPGLDQLTDKLGDVLDGLTNGLTGLTNGLTNGLNGALGGTKKGGKGDRSASASEPSRLAELLGGLAPRMLAPQDDQTDSTQRQGAGR